MKKQILLDKILSEKKPDLFTTEKLVQQLDDELNKKNIDYDVVDEINKYILEKRYKNIPEISNQEISNSIQELKKQINQNKSKRFKKIFWKAVSCAAALLIGLNVYTVSAYNENIFSFLVEFTKGGVLVQFNDSQKDEIIISVEENDPYGIVAECRKNGIENIETPFYLPEGFILTELEADNNDFSKYVHFTYKNGNQLISLNFEEYHDELPEKTGIPSNKYNITEIQINEHPAIMSREDNQMIVVCQYNNKSNDIFTQDVPYDECDKIINSYK